MAKYISSRLNIKSFYSEMYNHAFCENKFYCEQRKKCFICAIFIPLKKFVEATEKFQ